VKFPTVVLDQDHQIGIRKIGAHRASAESNTVLLHRAGEACTLEQIGDADFGIAVAGLEAGPAQLEDLAHDGAAPPPLAEMFGYRLEVPQRCQCPPQAIVDTPGDRPQGKPYVMSQSVRAGDVTGMNERDAT
jgi:hypothetical protein